MRRESAGMFSHMFLDTERMIREEMAFVQQESKKKIEKLRYAEDDHIGLEILHMFVLDVLGRETAVARIFESKAGEDFEYTQVVSHRAKALAGFGVFALNAFFVYYCMVRQLATQMHECFIRSKSFIRSQTRGSHNLKGA